MQATKKSTSIEPSLVALPAQEMRNPGTRKPQGTNGTANTQKDGYHHKSRNKKSKWDGDNGVFTGNVPEHIFDAVITEGHDKAYQFKVFKEKLIAYAGRKRFPKIPIMIRDLVPVDDKEFFKAVKPDKSKWTRIDRYNLGTDENPQWAEKTVISDKEERKDQMDEYNDARKEERK